MILITGGARSGKSTYAETYAKSFGDQVLYIATSLPLDHEMQDRIEKHRMQRPRGWKTLEAYKDFSTHPELTRDYDCILLDCVTILVTNLMFDETHNWDQVEFNQLEQVERHVIAGIMNLIEVSNTVGCPMIVVTNEVGMGIVPDTLLSRTFRDFAGRANQLLAKAANEVYLCVSGIAVKIK